MKASDVMVSPVITVKPTTTVKEVAKLFLDRGISAAPVLDEQKGGRQRYAKPKSDQGVSCESALG